MINLSLQVRTAVQDDYQQVAGLMSHEANAHRHLDWRSPLDWIGSPNYWILEEGKKIHAAFACPEDPAGVFWIRFFGHLPSLTGLDAWKALWDVARVNLPPTESAQVAAIVVKRWFQNILLSSGFEPRQNIILLELKGEDFKPAMGPRGINLRPMQERDLHQVARLDLEAFGPFWHNTGESLQRALAQSVYASVAEDDSGIIGYQLSTGNPFGAHLARLAVKPGLQGKGIGAGMVSDLIEHLDPIHMTRLSVNTQSDNEASLALYRRLGFTPTGEHFPVLVFPLDRQASDSEI